MDPALAQEDFAPEDPAVKTPAPAATLLDQVQKPVENTPPSKRSDKSDKVRKFFDALGNFFKGAISGGIIQG
ncbi:hypothetical protein ElyMa_006017700 [Elysia marginata]|uniref:Signal recognition particle-docking protein FtsY n=1 Tax=Elysia marginata TaxID=1093978 RepID=A0AAV4GJ69_9GAST|nr:hypothetical protein ElyMa_006017700 [Elysia marginata]